MKLAFDIGIHCGVAAFSDDGMTLLWSETKWLGCSRACAQCRAAGAVRVRMEDETETFFRLRALSSGCGAQWAYERVRRHNGVDAAHVYGGIQASLIRNAYLLSIPVAPIEVSAWKKAIGVKGPSKEAYLRRVNEITRLELSLLEEDRAAAIGIGLAAFCPDPSIIQLSSETP